MPRIPTFQRQVQEQAAPNVRVENAAGPQAFGAGVGQAVQQVGSNVRAISNQVQEFRDQADLAAVMAGERQLQGWQNEALFTPETGAFAQRGQAAFGLPEKVLPEFDKRAAEIEAKLPESARRRFAERKGMMRTQTQRDLLRHVGQEAEAFQKAEVAGYVESSLNTAALYARTDPARGEQEMRQAQGAFLVGNPQLPPAAQKQALLEIESSYNSAVIRQQVEADPIAAQSYLEAHSANMTEQDRVTAERLLKPAVMDAKADEDVARAMAAGGSKGDVLKRLNAIDNPDQRRAAGAKYRTILEIQNIAEAERNEAFTENINSKVEAALPGQNLREVLSPTEYAWAAEQGKLSAWEGRQRQRLERTEPMTDPKVFDSLQAMMVRAENGDKASLDQVRKLDMTDYFTKLDSTTRDQLQNRRLSILKPDAAGANKTGNYQSEDEMLNLEVFSKLGISRKEDEDDSDEVKATRYRYMTGYWGAIASREAEKGGPLSNAEKQQVAKDLMLPFAREVKGTFWGTNQEIKRAYEVNELAAPELVAGVTVPEQDAKQIAADFRAVYGRDPLPREVRRYYVQGLDATGRLAASQRVQGFAPQLDAE